MCFSPKIKTPKIDTSAPSFRAVDPAPLTEKPTGVLFGGDEDEDDGVSSEVPSGKGRSSLKIKIDKSVINSKRDGSMSSKGSNKRTNSKATTAVKRTNK